MNRINYANFKLYDFHSQNSFWETEIWKIEEMIKTRD